MKQRVLNFIILLFCFAIFGNTANASLAHNSTLLMGPQSSHCLNDSGTPGACTDFEIPDTNYFAVDYWNPHTNNFTYSDYVFTEEERVAIEPGLSGGIILGTTQDIGEIDSSWAFNNGIGYHYTRSPVTVITDDNNGNVVLNMSGLTIWFNDSFIPLDDIKDIVGLLTCGNTCNNGDTFVLEARTVLPSSCGAWGPCDTRDDYLFHMEGTISSVPVPATIWLFGSGLIGLIGLARRKA